jgi:hypothetical protein
MFEVPFATCLGASAMPVHAVHTGRCSLVELVDAADQRLHNLYEMMYHSHQVKKQLGDEQVYLHRE